MFDHVSLAVSDLHQSKRFYDQALAPLGIVAARNGAASCAYQLDGSDGFRIHAVPPDEAMVAPPRQYHLAFAATSRHAVERFYRAALEAGGTGDGPPGLRPQYRPGYYAAFVLDPDGHRIEAVFHDRR